MRKKDNSKGFFLSDGWNKVFRQMLSDLMFVIKRDGTYSDFKAESDEDLAIAPSEIIGKNIRDTGFSQIYLDRVFHHIEKAIDTGRIQTFEFELEVPTGLRYWDTHMAAINDDEVLVLVHDITERKQAEVKLLFTQFAVDHAVDGITWIGSDARFRYINNAFCRALGYSREELLSMTIHDIDPNFPKERWATHWEDVKLREFRVIETVHRTKNGLEIPVEVAINHQVFGGEEYHCAFVRDIAERKRTEKELEQSRMLMFSITEGTSDAVFVKDAQGRYLMINIAGANFVGMSQEAIVGKDDTALFPPNQAKKLMEEDRRSMQMGKPVTYEESLTVAGSIRTFLSTKGPVMDPQGNVIGLFGIARDITERKKIEEALKESEERYRMLFESAADAIFILDTEGEEGGSIIAANKAAAEMHGYTINELLTLNIRDLDTPNVAKDAPGRIERMLRGEWVKAEITHRKKDGTVFPVEMSAGLLALSNHKYILAFDRDITERKRVEDDLHKSEKRLSDITSSLAEGIYVLDERGYLTFMNEEAERLLGWTLSELKNKNAHNIVHFRRADGTLVALEDCPMYRVIETGRRFFSQDEVFVRKDGTVFPISVLTSALREDGKIVASVTAFRDITERKKLELELLKAQKLESIGILAGGIAHDFNNLLQAIMGNISLAKTYTGLRDKLFERLANAEKACEQAKELSYRLLTFSKGGEPITKTTFMRSLLKDAVRFSLSGSNTVAEFAIADGLYPVEIDEGQMNQVINNLVKNAQEAMPDGGVITLRASNITVGEKDDSLEKKGNYVKISIEDHGTGIPEENLTKIFDPYFTTKDMGRHKGSGLGLAISHSIIKKHGGLITIESNAGVGTTFHIYLPASDKAVKQKEKMDERYISGRGKILVMDDDKRVRDISGQVLEYLKYDVAYASDGHEAIDLYKKAKESGHPFDAVILDLTIPGGMGGEKVLEKLIEIDPKVKGIVSSGYTNNPIMTDCRKYGFAAAMAKPYTVQELSRMLSKILA